METADELLKYARQIISGVGQNKKLSASLTEKPETVKRLVSLLLEYFHYVADKVIPRADISYRQSRPQSEKIQLMWKLWPILHRLLVLQSNIDTDSDDYDKKASELYGILAQALESPDAVALLRDSYTEVLPLPNG